jgi:hypothetical protein
MENYGLINSNNPIQHEGKIYDKLFLNMAISQRHVEPNQRLTASVSVRLTPCRQDPETLQVEQLEDQAKAVVFADAFEAAQSDPDVAAALQAIIMATYQFVDAKGI